MSDDVSSSASTALFPAPFDLFTCKVIIVYTIMHYTIRGLALHN